jgi:tetratricopeptide (TPR) repeat protein
MQRRLIHFLFVILAVMAITRQYLTAQYDKMQQTLTSSPYAALIKEAEAADRAKNPQRAVDLYTSVIADDNTFEADRHDLLRRRGSVREWAGQYEEAEKDFNAAMAIKPADAAIYFRRGLFFQRRHRYDEALNDLAAGKGLDPTDPWFGVVEGEVFSERGDHRAAVAHYSEAIRLDPNMVRARLERGSEYNYENMYAEARDDYDAALNNEESKRFLPPSMIGMGYLGRGYASLHLKEYQQSIADFDKVLEIVPRSSNALKWRGTAYHSLGDRVHALADYRAALAIVGKDEWISDQVRLLEEAN